MTTPTDDELLALAKKAANAYGGGAPWEQYFAAVKDPAAIIALIERHRAEVERLTRKAEHDMQSVIRSANALASQLEHQRDAAESALAAAQKTLTEIEAMARPTDTPNDALDRIRALALNGPAALAKYTRPPEEVGDDISVQLAVELSEAQTALAAAQKRVGDIEAALFPPSTQNDDGSWVDYSADANLDSVITEMEMKFVPSDPVCLVTLMRIHEMLIKARAALAGKDATGA